ncbi:glycoprotein-N-acetylgalactosamine 3-beta-galactosyltransferase 1 isoform X2 [Eurytemora carolleeae]|uniref:glycoprotein-N-acetylgalactosamine 3-beta-galactosyltransferase 1 isoform X2 n=1 Tax=Eurytemora carolleeae TaxID=1294199 RepID=UPI000C7601EF|nr:glycoprotein-N-acetylgalactosamine 3-beta-galactosyltransferase 1 isoform X2 [Eurytemora carolleeae]|eukprot:XP_023343140.1 glycoprotein-N-acetylgalactosamine 3-beta-galactosyltransferase 1-like isoform X2 [Eurytemora affinis]
MLQMITVQRWLVSALAISIIFFWLGLLHRESYKSVLTSYRSICSVLTPSSTEELEYRTEEEDYDLDNSNKYALGSEFMKFKAKKSPIRLLCLVITQPKAFNTTFGRVRAINDTWGSRCTFLYFVSSESTVVETGYHVLHNPVKENYGSIWSKTKLGFKFAFKNHIQQVDWVMKTDDDTYVIMENLHEMLSRHDPDKPAYFGSHLNFHVKQGYMSGGSGYILSRKAVELLVTSAFPNQTLCRGK